MTTGFSFAGTAFAGLPNVLGAGAEPGAAAGSLPGNGSSGLTGLFSGLVDANGISAPITTTAGSDMFADLSTPSSGTASVPDLSTLLAGLQTTVTAGSSTTADPLAALQALLQGAGVQLAATPNSSSTDDQQTATNSALQTLAAALQQVQQAAGQNNLSLQDLTNPANLKTVLQSLGVSGDKADSLVASIQSTLAKLKKTLSLSSDQLSALTPAIIAASVAPLLQNPLTNQPLVSAKTPLNFTLTAQPVSAQTPDSSPAQSAAQKAANYPATNSIAREVAGIKTSDGSKVKTNDDDDDTTPQVAAPVANAALPAVAVTIDPTGVSVKPTTVGNRPFNAATVQSVAPGKVLAPINGDVKFTWKGEDTATPVADTTPVSTASTDSDVKANTTSTTKVDLTLTTQTARADLLAQTTAQIGAAKQTNGAAQSDFAKQVEQFQQKVDLAQRYDVAGQTVVQMKSLIDQGGGEIRVTLNPPELGQIHVELTVKDGSVSGKISASDPAVVNALASDVKQFGDGLKQAGFKLGQDGLSFMLNQQNSQQQQQSQQQQAQNTSGNFIGGDTSVDDETANLATWVAPNRLLDVNI